MNGIRKSSEKPRRIRRIHSSNYSITFAACILMVSAAFIAARPQSQQAQEQLPIRVANEDDLVVIPAPLRAVARGERLDGVPTTMLKWPKSRISADYIRNIAEHKDAIVTMALPKLLPIPLSALSLSAVEGNAVVEGIPSGMRAITLRVDPESAVEGWAQSGNYVDVILVRIVEDSSHQLETKVIADNIRILSAGRSAEPGDRNTTAPQAPTTVTLLTTQEQALAVKTAATLGKLTFALRGAGDKTPTEAIRMDQRTLLGSNSPAQNQPKEIQGFARGPDGKVYVLSPGSKWLEKNSPLSNFAAANRTNNLDANHN